MRYVLTSCFFALTLCACSSSSAPTCGDQGQPCCGGITCNAASLVCLSDVCTAPQNTSVGSSGPGNSGTTGRVTGSATSGTTTGSSNSSSGGICGGASEACCAGDICNGSLTCQAGTCAQPASGVSGTPCTKNSDCPTGICLPVGQPSGENGWTGNVCSIPCSSASSCVAGWTCGALAGQSGDVCQCHYSPEVCDGLDNDCDGIVDNEPAVDAACASDMGAGAICQGGSCVCGGSTILCGDRCANTQTDAQDCGGCVGQGGAVCPASQSCVGGSCVCPSSAPTFCSGSQTCSDTQTDAKNCGGCAGEGGQACPSPQACVAGVCACGAETTGVCCYPAATTCASDSDCCSGNCTGTCQVGWNGASCLTSADCYSENCVQNVCQCTNGPLPAQNSLCEEDGNGGEDTCCAPETCSCSTGCC